MQFLVLKEKKKSTVSVGSCWMNMSQPCRAQTAMCPRQGGGGGGNIITLN